MILRRGLQVRVTEAALQVLGDLYVPEPWDLGEFLDRLAELRGRPIRLVTLQEAIGIASLPRHLLCGLWADRGTEDWIFYNSLTSGFGIDLSIVHEVCHMLLNHQPRLPDELVRRMFPLLSKAPSWLAAAPYGAFHERDVERLARLILTRADPGGITDATTRRLQQAVS